MVDVRLERCLRIGEHGEVELLAGANLGRFAFADIGDQPDGREIADGEHRIDDAGRGVADVLAGADLALHDGAAERRVDRRLGADLALLLKRGDFRIGLAEDGEAIARRFQGGLGCLQVGARLSEIGGGGLEIAKRTGPALIERAVLLLDDLGDGDARLRAVDARERGQEIVLRRHHIGGFEVEQRLAGLHGVARLRHQPRHAPGVRREDRRRAILVDRNLAFGHVFGPKHHRLDRLEAKRVPLLGRRLETRHALGLAGDFSAGGGDNLRAALILRHHHDDNSDDGQHRDHDDRVRVALRSAQQFREPGHRRAQAFLPPRRLCWRLYSRKAHRE